jgi:DNA-binding NarL/FixJ family response regulator
MAADEIGVFLVDDHTILRAGVRLLLDREPGIRVVGEASDGGEVIARCAQTPVDVIVVDVALPGVDGIELTRQLTAHGTCGRVVACSARADTTVVAAMLRAGARGFVCKDAAVSDLAAAIRAVARGETFLSPGLMRSVLGRRAAVNGTAAAAFGPALTAREREMLQLLAAGQSTKEVARELRVSVKTAETHRRNMMEKLEVDSIAELTRYAIREGISSL